ncbi:protease inhibitor I42 family protein [Nocardia sp. NPDC088792]|uniref:protease inhibitor I42 family protein n=1 Tax=Nocardia sp. NPDC088792 TaxID=3364332 RepID=UPI00380F1EAF
MRMRTPVLMVLAGLLMVAGCGKNDSNDASKTTSPAATTTASTSAVKPTPDAHPAVRIGSDSDGKAITLTAGQGLVVTLDANPTTGFTWALTDLDQNIVKQNGAAEYEQDPNPDGRVGVGGKSVLNFVAANPGGTRLVLEYKRSWEQGVPPAKTFSVNLTVQ